MLHRPIITGFLLAIFTIAGCGIKGPPVPPKTPPVPTVAQLGHRLDDATVILEWALPERLPRAQAQTASFGIYRSRGQLSEPLCATCPLVFEHVGTVPYTDIDGGRFFWTAPLDGGYRYTFKVRLAIDGRIGADSNLVRFDFAPN